MDQSEADRKALEDFVVGNADLEKLEAMLDSFNIFEAVGMSRQEIRHSTFLSFLLDPNQPHGLGDAFLKRFLQSAVSSSSTVVTPIELSLWNLDGMTVQREWNNIDIFLLDDENSLAIIIENKLGTTEHSNQLERYYDIVRKKYPSHKLLAIYLSPDGSEPSHSEYLSLDYGTFCRVLDEVRQSRSSVIEPDIAVLATHYTDMMRRNFVGDSEIARLSQQIYQRHHRAINVIVEHMPDRQDLIRQAFEAFIGGNPDLILDHSTKSKMQFAIMDWDAPVLMSGSGWTASGRILLFEIVNNPDFLDLKLLIGPGDAKVREALLNVAKSNGHPFRVAQRLANKHNTIYSLKLIKQNVLQGNDFGEVEHEIKVNWNDFLENDLPRIDAALRAEEWIWEDTSEPAPE